jgi:nucleotidyltransferase/DNA polymerase involved in DNA repair
MHHYTRQSLVSTSFNADENGSIDERAAQAGHAVDQADASIRGKACLERYRKASSQIFAIFKAFFPNVVIEKASIDEAFLGALASFLAREQIMIRSTSCCSAWPIFTVCCVPATNAAKP